MCLGPSDLERIYADTDDPWDFDQSPYEQEKFAATRAALSRPRYRAGLELGCGNGALARHVAPLCDRYVGIDAVPKAVAAARTKAPSATFLCARYPCPLPDGAFDLVVLSEVLYFLAPEDLAHLAGDLAGHSPDAEIVCVTFLGDTERLLQGFEAFELFAQALPDRYALLRIVDGDGYRIDRALPRAVT